MKGIRNNAARLPSLAEVRSSVKIINSILLITFLALIHQGQAQDFVNSDFENPVLPLIPNGGLLQASDAIPGWTAYRGSSSDPTIGAQTLIYYNGLSLGGAIVALQDENAPVGVPLPIQGSYSVLLEGSIPFAATSASIGQTGTIPATAQSLTFFLGNAFGNLQVTFNGQSISYSAIGNGANYTIYGADISSYAGQTAQLLFTAPAKNAGLLDNIQFSNSPVPEPSEFALGALGA